LSIRSQHFVLTGKKTVDALGLNKGRDAQVGALLDVILGRLDLPGDPLVGDSDTDVEGAASGFGTPRKAGLVEGVGCLVHPIPNVALEELGSFLLNSHPRQQVGNAGVDRSLGVLVHGILEARTSLISSEGSSC
jgi:hypothetical protein